MIAAYFGMSESYVMPENYKYKDGDLQIQTPERPLGAGSVQIGSCDPAKKRLTQWTSADHESAYRAINALVRTWQEQGIDGYLIYGRESSNSSVPFSWEVVPYSDREWWRAKQFNVLWNIAINQRIRWYRGPYLDERQSLSKQERNGISQKLNQEISENLATPSEKVITSAKKALEEQNKFCNFCSDRIIKAQQIYEGKHIRVLLDYAPLTKFHVLLVTKAHRQKFSDLKEEEYLENASLTKDLIEFYEGENKEHCAVHKYAKADKKAGQTIPHWHEHLVFTTSDVQERSGEWTIFRKMLLGPLPLPNVIKQCLGIGPLSKDQLKADVEKYSKAFKEFKERQNKG